MTKPKKSRYMFVDGNALIHRGFHAVPGLQTKTGEPTGAVYGFTMILLKAVQDIKPTHIGVSFDLAGPTFRHKMYDEYKAHRVAASQDLYDQIPRVKEVVEALNMPIFVKEGFEADDVLGTLAQEICKHEKEKCEVFIVTGDLDTLQLIDNCVKIYTMRKGVTDTVIYDEKAVRERYGLLPNQMVDYKALRGDPSDNIPGVKGIGEKTASELIQQFKSLEGLYSAIESGKAEGNIKPRILDLLKEHKQIAFQSYTLSQIVKDVPLSISIPAYVLDQVHYKKTISLFQELEFKSLVSKLPKAEERATDDQTEEIHEEKIETVKLKQEYTLIENNEQLETLIQKLQKVKELALDTETTGLSTIDAELLGISLSFNEGEGYYVPVEFVTDGFKKILADTEIKKIGHNIKYDSQILLKANCQVSGVAFDTMIASFLLNSGSRQHNLDTLAFNELGYQMQPIEDLIGKGKKQISMRDVPVEKVSWYSCEDADMTLRLKNLFEPQLRGEKLDKIFNDIEMPLIPVLSAMELAGIKVDVTLLNRLSGTAEIELKNLEEDIYKLTGEEFNINSPKQLKEVLFDKLQIQSHEVRKTKTGLSTAAGELEKLVGQHPVIPKLLEYRELAKLQSTYLLSLPQLVNKITGRIHTSYNQTIAATGRLSSTDPNLQNIPVRGNGLGSEVRKAFVAEKGYKLLSLDYSQIELRVVAHVSHDAKMVEVFKSGQDIHAKTAMEIFNVAANKVTADMRRDAKTINFGILYGVSSFGLSERIREMSRYDAKQFIEKYFKAYPGVEEYIEQVKLQVNETGFVRNELGRLRKFPEIKSSQFFIRAAAERAAINFPMQSLAADIIKVAMIDIHKLVSESAGQLVSKVVDLPEIRMLLQVHDELVFEVKEDKVEEWAMKIKPLMENSIKLSVPLEVEAKVGDNWGELEKLIL